MTLPTPRRRPSSYLRRAVVAISIGTLVVVATAGVVWFFTPSRSCGAGGGNAALSCVLVLGRGSGVCPSGNGSSSLDCAYVFGLIVTSGDHWTPPLHATNLNFLLVDARGAIQNLAFSVTLVSASGCGIAAYNSSYNFWADANSPGQCQGSSENTTPLQLGDRLAMTPIPRGGLPFSGAGYQLMAIGVGALSGSVLAGID